MTQHEKRSDALVDGGEGSERQDLRDTAVEGSAQFTRGPWKVEAAGSFDDKGEPIVGVFISAGEFQTLACVMPRKGEVGPNARLMAAAPELYDSLYGLFTACHRANSTEELPPEIDGTLLDAAYKALRKAEGRA